jgi:hypothetical protein
VNNILPKVEFSEQKKSYGMTVSEYKEKTKRGLLRTAIDRKEMRTLMLSRGDITRPEFREELEIILKIACLWLSEDLSLVCMWYGKADRLELAEDRSKLFNPLQDCYRMFNGNCEKCKKVKVKADEIHPILQEVRSHMETSSDIF